MRTVLSTVAALLYVSIVFAGSGDDEMFANDIKSVSLKLAVEQKFTAEIVILNKSVSGFLPSVNAVIHRSGVNAHISFMKMEYLFTAKRSIVVDHKRKFIAYSTPTVKQQDVMKRLLPAIDSFSHLYDSVVYKGTVDGKRKYCVYKSKGLIMYAEVYFDPVTGFFSKLLYRYNPELTGEEGIIIIEYRNVSFSPAFDSDEFDDKKFISLKNGTVVPARALSGYSISEAQTSFDNY